VTITVLYGVPGAGKTHLYKEKYNNFPLCDISSIYEQQPGINWHDATYIVAQKAIACDNEVGGAVIEGLFLPGTPSRILLERKLNGHKVEWIQVHAPYETCRQRIIVRKQANEEVCLAILQIYYKAAERAWDTMAKESKQNETHK